MFESGRVVVLSDNGGSSGGCRQLLSKIPPYRYVSASSALLDSEMYGSGIGYEVADNTEARQVGDGVGDG